LFLCVWCSVIFPGETRSLYSISVGNKVMRPFLLLTIMILVSVFMVSLSDYVLNNVCMSNDIRYTNVMTIEAWITNILILFGAYTLAFAITCKVSTSLVFVSPFYVILNLATLAKMKYMHTAVSPLDLINIILAIVAWIVALVMLRRIAPVIIPFVFRLLIMCFSSITLLSVPVLYSWSDYDMNEYFRMIGGPEFHLTKYFHKESGVLLTYLAEVPSSFIRVPSGYSKDKVKDASSVFMESGYILLKKKTGKNANLIIIMIESFMDPAELGYRYTYDPIPNFRALQLKHGGGHVVVPGPFGGSINSEFEALTGMSTSFLPDRSVPYRQFLKRPTPSLPQAMKNAGYRTIAVQADPKNWFNREKVYDLLGFDEKYWLHDDPVVERSLKGFWPSNRAVVDRIIQASKGRSPYFIFSFPSDTHAPYDTGVYGNSDLKIVDAAKGDAVGEVEEYVNLLRVTDMEINRIINYFSHHPDPTILVVLGDHLPPLSGDALRPFYAKQEGLLQSEQEWKIRRVPILVWANFDHTREKIELSMNALPSYLLEKMKLPAPGFLAVSDVFRRRLPVLSKYVKNADGSVWNLRSLPLEERSLVDSYSLLQYDMLVGNRYSTETALR
jgi:hypothetical protein